jgi:hypothetical protein
MVGMTVGAIVGKDEGRGVGAPAGADEGELLDVGVGIVDGRAVAVVPTVGVNVVAGTAVAVCAPAGSVTGVPGRGDGAVTEGVITTGAPEGGLTTIVPPTRSGTVPRSFGAIGTKLVRACS